MAKLDPTSAEAVLKQLGFTEGEGAPVFWCAVQPESEPPFIASRTGLRLRTKAAAEAVLGTYLAMFVAGSPIKPWPPFLPEPDQLRAEGAELQSCMQTLRWADS